MDGGLGRVVIAAALEDGVLEVTVLMPCLDEAETIERCVGAAQGWLARSGVCGEVLVADNGSNDGSPQLAEAAGARVVKVDGRGYGSAIMGGVEVAKGRFVIVGDADDTYDFGHLDPFVTQLRDGDVLVVGNRFRGGIEPGAMPWLHRHVGNPILSALGRRFFHVDIGDFHCGLRGFDRQVVRGLGLRTTGMEFASEMIVKTSLAGHPVSEVPTTLSVGGRTRAPHLRTWSDGWRHLRFLLLYSPRWLFKIPGLVAFLVGAALVGILAFDDLDLGSVRLSTGTMIYAAALCVLGWQSLLFGIFVQEYAVARGLLPSSTTNRTLREHFRSSWGSLAGVGVALVGILSATASLLRWGRADFADLDPVEQVRIVVPSSLCLVLGLSMVLASFVWSFLQLPVGDRRQDG
jgi:glycosyltransferase involved in cell wall biosynthesis